MARPHALTTLEALVTAIAVTLAVTFAGCGGGLDVFGGAAGWVYQPIGGGQAIVSASDTPPAGYEPVVGAVVRIDGYPQLTTTTDSNGYYYIANIPPGTRTLVVEVPGQAPLRLSIPIIGCRITLGSGHQEGGGGIS